MTKAENGQIVREYVSRGEKLKFSNIAETVMYKIDKNGNTVKIAEYDNDLKLWIKE